MRSKKPLRQGNISGHPQFLDQTEPPRGNVPYPGKGRAGVPSSSRPLLFLPRCTPGPGASRVKPEDLASYRPFFRLPMMRHRKGKTGLSVLRPAVMNGAPGTTPRPTGTLRHPSRKREERAPAPFTEEQITYFSHQIWAVRERPGTTYSEPSGTARSRRNASTISRCQSSFTER